MKTLLALALLAMAGCMSDAPDGASQPAAAAQSLREPDVRYVPSSHRVVRAMLRLARVRPGDVVYDLGSGDGRIPIAAARDFGARGVGIDIDPVRISEAEANARKAGVADRVVFRNEDLFEADFRDATVVTLFLQRHLNLRLRPRLLAELAPGTRIVSYWHDMGDWKPDRRERAGDSWVYLWTVPAR
ncbi:MAG TPA: methyltransferase domain-containing protein [Allosphingosinicella sp.]